MLEYEACMIEADEAIDPQGPDRVELPSGRTLLRGVVTAIAHGFVQVHTCQGSLLCTLRGRLTRPPGQGQARSVAAGRGAAGRQPQAPERDEPIARVMPGDDVIVRQLGGGRGVVEEILPRRRVLARSGGEAGGARVMLANPDHAVLVFAVREPAPHFGMLDRYLALCEHAGVDVTICLNKVDLGISEDIEETASLYSGLGYRVLYTSAVNGEHVAALKATLRGRISLLTGPSGVGKSSLVNILIPDADQRIGEVSEATGKGRHTTTGVRLLPLDGGGWLADSAGIRELALWNVPPEELPQCFVELRPVADECVYEDCTHGEDEEGCALQAALAEGRITPERWASFERLLLEARGEGE
jgi:ribosome biogenesis GTPase / thiamine phosphate phosphatase